MLLGLSLFLLLLSVILDCYGSLAFQRFIGDLNPILFIIVVLALGLILLTFMTSRGWIVIYENNNSKGIYYASLLALIFGLVIIIIDLVVIFPDGIHIRFPDSVFFYPVMGFVVEVLFHVVPLFTIFLFLTLGFKRIPVNNFWISLWLVAVIEPVYQVLAGFSSEVMPWVLAYVGFHVLAINICQLVILNRFDFISMYAFRLIYYLIWHIGWGYLRLQWFC